MDPFPEKKHHHPLNHPPNKNPMVKKGTPCFPAGKGRKGNAYVALRSGLPMPYVRVDLIF